MSGDVTGSRNTLAAKVLHLLHGRGLGRVILDRGPSWPDYHKAEPWMERYYLLFRRRPKWFPFNIFLHHPLKGDVGEMHGHSYAYVTVVLKGGYWETTNEGRYWRAPGYVGVRKSTTVHRIELEPGIEVWTIFFAGPLKANPLRRLCDFIADRRADSI